ncbi:MAG: DDE-type integrase/transposase/recombinase, partial [Brevinema sp.]
IYTDSAYAHGVCHAFGAVWAQRGFLRADGTAVKHGKAIDELLKAMMLPKSLAIVKCMAHKKDSSIITRGNTVADEMAKKAALGQRQASVMELVEDQPSIQMDLTVSDIKGYQETASETEKLFWVKRGAVLDPKTGLWRSCDGVCAAPTALLPMLIKDAHGVDHCNKKEVVTKIRKDWWSPYLAAMVDDFHRSCELCATRNVRKHFTAPISHIPQPQGPFRHLVMDFVDMAERKEGKRYILVVVDRFSRWVEAVATSKNDAITVATFLCREVIPRFGIPDKISSDNGTHFVSEVIKAVAEALCIKKRMGCVYHPQSQGMVERANGVLKEKVAKICADTGLTWVQALPLALMKMRTQTNRNTHLTPHQMLTGRPMPVPAVREPYEGPPLEQLEGELASYMRHLTKIHSTLCSQVKEAVHGEPVTEGAPLVEPGDNVYIKRFKRKNWQDPRREGPFKVVAATSTAVKVEGKEHWYHLNHCCRAAALDPSQSKPEPEQRKGGPDTDSDSDDDHPDGDGPARRTRAKGRRREEKRMRDEVPSEGDKEHVVTVPESTDPPAVEQTRLGDSQVLVDPRGDGEVAGPSGLQTQQGVTDNSLLTQPQAPTEVVLDLPDDILAFDPGPNFLTSPYSTYSTLNLEQAAEIFPSLAALVSDSPKHAGDTTTSAI